MVSADARDRASVSYRKLLLDSPTEVPALGYREVGQAFATIISNSEPRFSIGIFGGWGSGKTTLMTAIKAALSGDDLVIVDFNAWRFEREPHLLVPLLDTIRAELVKWSEPRDAGTREQLRSIANRIGRVVRALATGLSAEIGISGVAKVKYDLGATVDNLSTQQKGENAQSLYVAAFQELETAFSELRDGGVTRVVVFVDDLDRCLPGNALDLLESVKLFFDLPGFIFVVGLDQEVVQRAIRAKFIEQEERLPDREDFPRSGSSSASHRLGYEYVKKIFQVPYSLPAMVPEQLDDLLAAMYTEAALGSDQLRDLQERVRPYLEFVAVERRVNPREVKRFINAYTLQTIIRPELHPDTVLALQTLVFRYEWNILYEAILTGSESFIQALGRFRAGNDDAFKALSSGLAALPTSLSSYLRSNLAAPLTYHASLDSYLSSLQSTRTTGSWVSEAYGQISRLRGEIRSAAMEDPASGISPTLVNNAINVARNVEGLFSTARGPEASTSLLRLPRRITEVASDMTLSAQKPHESKSILRSMQELIDNAIEELERLRESRDFQI